MRYEIPKEIRSKPKILGLEMKEIVIVIIGFVLIFTLFKDLVHSVFVIPYLIVSGITFFWAFLPSRNNPGVKNYISIYFFYKHSKQTYHALDSQKVINEVLYENDEQGKGGEGF